MTLDPALTALLKLDPAAKTSLASGPSGCSSARSSKITVENADGSKNLYFLKTGSGRSAEVMFRGEHASLSALSIAVPGICPRSFGHGTYRQDRNTAFLVTEFLDTSASSKSSSSQKHSTLARKLAQLHTTPAPVPDGYDTPQFGFAETTCCGDTPQDNSYESSWMTFYQNRRLRFILSQAEKNQGPDDELRETIERTCEDVVPRLLGDKHLNSGKGITPVVVHGDLWSGNAARGSLSSSSDSTAEDVIFDSSACYAHSEYELGIMRMFGGFGESFLKEYHSLVPKTEPAEEYPDRVRLYEVYHHLNHYAMFGGGYRSGAIAILRELLNKYGTPRS